MSPWKAIGWTVAFLLLGMTASGTVMALWALARYGSGAHG